MTVVSSPHTNKGYIGGWAADPRVWLHSQEWGWTSGAGFEERAPASHSLCQWLCSHIWFWSWGTHSSVLGITGCWNVRPASPSFPWHKSSYFSQFWFCLWRWAIQQKSNILQLPPGIMKASLDCVRFVTKCCYSKNWQKKTSLHPSVLVQ